MFDWWSPRAQCANGSGATSPGWSTRGLGACRTSRGPRTGHLGRLRVRSNGTCLLNRRSATLLPTGEFVENGLPVEAMVRLIDIELREPDVNKFSVPPRATAGGEPERSDRR